MRKTTKSPGEKIVKDKSRLWIDGAVGLVMAAGVWAKGLEDAPKQSYLETSDMHIL